MQYGQRYRFQFGPTIYEGEYIQTKGDDDNYPTFVVEDGPRLGVHKDHVLGPVDDSCPPQGIERPAHYDAWDYNPVTLRWEIDTLPLEHGNACSIIKPEQHDG